jgi:hypothetical protein
VTISGFIGKLVLLGKPQLIRERSRTVQETGELGEKSSTITYSGILKFEAFMCVR